MNDNNEGIIMMERYVKCNDVLRQYYASNPVSIWLPYEVLIQTGAFKSLDFTPDEHEVATIWRSTLSSHDFPNTLSPELKTMCRTLSSPTDDAGVLHTVKSLIHLLADEPEYLQERDLETLIDAVAVYAILVPTPQEIVEAMRMIKLPAVPPLSDLGEDESPSENESLSGAENDSTLELEGAIRRAQKAPLGTSPVQHSGQSHNYVQQWLSRRGVMDPRVFGFRISIKELVSELRDAGFLTAHPSEEAVKKILKKLVKEIKQAEKRHENRQRRKHNNPRRSC